MTNDLTTSLLVVLSILGGLAGLLVLLTMLDPTTVRRPATTSARTVADEPASSHARSV